MAEPLFTVEEKTAYETERRAPRPESEHWEKFWAQRQAKDRAHLVKMIQRAQARPNEFLNGLIILVGNRGAKFIDFDEAFAKSDSQEVLTELGKVNTPETRRNLFTILKALTEIPKSWAASAFIRFLRGTGKQKDAKYHGAGTFGVLFRWKEDEVKAIVEVIADGRNPYSQVLMSYADMYKEIREMDDADNKDYAYGTEFYATRVERDVEFLNKLCEMLEKQGLGPIPTPDQAKPKKDRKAKQFQAGDIIKKSTIRDLPLPAHVRLNIERRDEKTDQWLDSTLEVVVTDLANTGRFRYALIPNGKTAYFEGYPWKDKSYLEGATFLKKWDGEISKKEITHRVFYRKRSEER